MEDLTKAPGRAPSASSDAKEPATQGMDCGPCEPPGTALARGLKMRACD